MPASAAYCGRMPLIRSRYCHYPSVFSLAFRKNSPRSRLDCVQTQSDVSVRLPGGRAVMRKVSDKEREKLSTEIDGLESLDLHQLRIRWKLLYEIEAPPHLSRDWLRRAV